MDRSDNKGQKLLLNILYIAIIFTVTNLIGEVISVEIGFFSQLLIVIIISTVIKYFTKYPLFLLISLVLGFFIMLIIDTYRSPIFLPIAERVSHIFSNLIGNLQGNESIAHDNINSIYILVLILISIYTSIIIYRSKRIFLLIPVYLPIFLAYWYSFIDKSFNLVALFLLFFLILLGFEGYKTSNFSDNKVFKRWLGTTIAYSLLIVILAFFIPKSNDFIRFPWLQQKVYNKFPIIEELRYYKEYNRETGSSELFNFSTSGFSEEDSDLGGPLVQTDKKVMTVETDVPVYLRGNAKDLYNGKRWSRSSIADHEFDLRDDISFVFEEVGEERDKMFKKEELSIMFDSYTSKTIFTPYKPLYINSNRNLTLNVAIDGIINSEEGVYKNEGYYIEFLNPLPYGDLIENQLDMNKEDLMTLDIYLQVPENITDRTKELTSTLVEGLNTDYEKAIAIQDHLRNNYTYKLDVDNLPEDEEFIDYFLFQQQEGYCTYYASAMAVMLRLENIPTRYVEGYIVDENIEANKYQVRQKHAHTWVEAFIEPVGWLSFEPTAAYEFISDTEDTDEVEPSPNMDEDIVPDRDDLPTSPDNDIEIPEEDNDPMASPQTDENSLGRRIRTSILLIFIILIILRILMRFIKYNAKQRFLSSLKNSEQIIYLYKDIIDLLYILGFPIIAGETHFEYANRISYKFTDLKDYGIKDITDLFVKIKYSKLEASDDELDKVINYKDQLDKRVKNKLGKFNYFYRKYIKIHFKKIKEIP